MPKISADRLLSDLHELRRIGEYKTGVHRPSRSPEDIASRHWLVDKLTQAGLKAQMAARLGPLGDQAVALYRARYPNKSPFLIQAQIATDAGFRKSAILQAERKAAQSPGKVWMYQWDWETPAYDGKFGAIHGIDVSASFHNYRDGMVGCGVASGRLMCDRLASTLIAFARTGNPNNDQIPVWPAYDARTRATMIFDNEMRVENDPRSEILGFWNSLPAPTAAR
jgi:para-nitrobenzyl esterase